MERWSGYRKKLLIVVLSYFQLFEGRDRIIKIMKDKTYTLTITLGSKESAIYTIEEVARLLKEGYTSGIDPTWDLVEEDN